MDGLIDWLIISKFYGTSTPKGHTVPKQVSPLDDDDDITEPSRKKMLQFYSLRTALCESIRYQAKSEQNVRQDLVPRVSHVEAALCTPEYPAKTSMYLSILNWTSPVA